MKLIYAACVLAAFASAQTETVQMPDFAKSSMKTHVQAEKKLIENALKGDLSPLASDLKIDKTLKDGDSLIINGAHYRTIEGDSTQWKEGDVVRLLSGNKDGRCLSSIMLNLRTKTVCKFMCDAY
nr:hypothetical protein [uncultured Campylobacter sp.]